MAELNIGVVSPYQNRETYSRDSRQILDVVSDNVGNMLFRYGVCSKLRNYIPVELKPDRVDEYREKIDILIYPTANQVNPKLTHLDYLSKFFSKLKKPVLLLGLGAQYEDSNSNSHDLHPGTVRYLKTVADYAYKIGVRGPFTAEILNSLGINNVEVIGCPSNFINPRSDLGAYVERKYTQIRSGKRSVAKAAYYPQHGTSYYTPKHEKSEKLLFELATRRRGGVYIINGPAPLLALGRNRAFETDRKQLELLHKFLKNDMGYDDFTSLMRSVSQVFTSVESWMEFLASCDVSLGKRIHGCIASVQATTPGIIIAHDSRTAELAETLEVPRISLSDFDNVKTDEDVLEKMTFNGSAYDKRRRLLFGRFQSIFDFHGIQLEGGLKTDG